MTGDQGHGVLRQAIGSMLAIEAELEEALAGFSGEAEAYMETPSIVVELRSQAAGRREALEAHLQELDEAEPIPDVVRLDGAFGPGPDNGQVPGDGNPIGALRAVGARFANAAFGYTVLHGLAHRTYRIPTANLADEHRVSCLRSLYSVHRAVADVVVQELLAAGQTCTCECPSCAPGICLCWHVHAEPWQAPPADGIVVRAPRAGSNAERAGVRSGDLILAVEARPIHSYQDMLDAMREHQPGAGVKLRIRRGVADTQEVPITR